MVAMSGGVDSSVAAALLQAQGHDVVGVTLKLWGGRTSSGCCSVADVDDARRVADQLGLVHQVFNLESDFTSGVVEAYVDSHAAGRTPNPCVECNRVIKFGRLLQRARRLGFGALATGHHARLRHDHAGTHLLRGTDAGKDQSYVLASVAGGQLADVMLPVGELSKDEVRAYARRLGMRVADKPDSVDTCFVGRKEERAGFLGARIAMREATLVDAESGAEIGRVPSAEVLTIGQRRGVGAGGGSRRRYVLDVDARAGRVLVGPEEMLEQPVIELEDVRFVGAPVEQLSRVGAQCSAHGEPRPGVLWLDGGGGRPRATLRLDRPGRRVAPGQLVALYDGDEVLGCGVAAVTRGVAPAAGSVAAGRAPAPPPAHDPLAGEPPPGRR